MTEEHAGVAMRRQEWRRGTLKSARYGRGSVSMLTGRGSARGRASLTEQDDLGKRKVVSGPGSCTGSYATGSRMTSSSCGLGKSPGT